MATITAIASFDRYEPTAGVIENSAGDLFEVASQHYTLFEIANSTTGYATTPTIIATFPYTDGGPEPDLVVDAAGDLFLTTGLNSEAGGGPGGTTLNYGNGIYEIANTATGYATPIQIASFGTEDVLNVSLAIDANGDLLGTVQSFFGGDAEGFEIANTSTGYVALDLGELSGQVTGQPLVDPNGNVFITTLSVDTAETVYELVKTPDGYGSPNVIISNYIYAVNVYAAGGLVEDSVGDLFGLLASVDGMDGGYLYEIANTSTGYASIPTILVRFSTTAPAGGNLAIDAAGDIFGVTGNGFVYEVPKTTTGYGRPFTLGTLAASDGALFGLSGKPASGLFITTTMGGAYGLGGVFEIGDAENVSCFGRGTRLATPRGELMIESLRVGDLVTNADGAVYPIVWIGHCEMVSDHHRQPTKIWPVRVRAGAFGANLPRHDLWLSPDHAVFVDQVLIPIKYLINGVTIVQVPTDRFSYYHVGLARHDVLVAEGLPVESYLPVGEPIRFNANSRELFGNLVQEVASASALISLRWDGIGYAPLIVSGPVLEAVRRRVHALAAAKGDTSKSLPTDRDGLRAARPPCCPTL